MNKMHGRVVRFSVQYLSAPKAFSEALWTIRPKMIATVFRLCGRRELAIECADATIAKLLEKWHQFEPGTNFAAWACTSTRNHFLSERRKAYRSVEWDETKGANIADDSAANPTMNLALEKALRAIDDLPEIHRTVLKAIAIDGLTIAESAVRLGVEIGTVKSRLTRARQALAGIFNPFSETS